MERVEDLRLALPHTLPSGCSLHEASHRGFRVGQYSQFSNHVVERVACANSSRLTLGNQELKVSQIGQFDGGGPAADLSSTAGTREGFGMLPWIAFAGKG